MAGHSPHIDFAGPDKEIAFEWGSQAGAADR
ncbi:MAG: hypothetical protein ACI91O_000908 [Candidatus Poriferisodalaceae bacterium]|jgi:hypothetical protein